VSCAEKLTRKPSGTLAPRQVKAALKLRGTMPVEDIAKNLGTSLSNLKRSCRGVRFAFHNLHHLNPDRTKEICAFYEKNGRRQTEKKYPGIRVRSVVESYKLFSPRTVKWKSEEILQAARMAGIVSMKEQAVFFNRPNANAGSIRSLWVKRMKFKGNLYAMHGLTQNKASYICEPSVPFYSVKVGPQHSKYKYKIAFWQDVAEHLKPGIPASWKQAIDALVRYEKKLYKGDPKKEILKIIKEMEK